jgi:hypothetical protein
MRLRPFKEVVVLVREVRREEDAGEGRSKQSLVHGPSLGNLVSFS